MLIEDLEVKRTGNVKVHCNILQFKANNYQDVIKLQNIATKFPNVGENYIQEVYDKIQCPNIV